MDERSASPLRACFSLPWMVPRFACSLLILIGLIFSAGAQGEPPPRGILQLGNAVVTGFSGASVAPGPLPAGVNPIEKTFIDLDGISARVIDLSALSGPPQGQLIVAAKPFAVTAAQVGQVF